MRLGRPMTARELFDLRVAIQREAAKDERIAQAFASIDWQARDSRLVIGGTIVPVVGQAFKFTLSIDHVAFAIGVTQ